MCAIFFTTENVNEIQLFEFGYLK